MSKTNSGTVSIEDALSGRVRYVVNPQTGELELRQWNTSQTRKNRALCGARCRTGEPCRAKVWIRPDGSHAARCRVHGGASTGPKSAQGREAIAQSNRRRAKIFAQNNGLNS